MSSWFSSSHSAKTAPAVLAGHNAGEVASTLGLATVLAELQRRGRELAASGEPVATSPGAAREAVLRESILAADAAVARAARTDESKAGMGATLTVLWFFPSSVLVGQVGDSRAYRLSGGRVAQISEDHTALARMIREGLLKADDARRHKFRGMIEQALGTIDHPVVPDVSTLDLCPGDAFLLSSDGLHDPVGDADIGTALARIARGRNPSREAHSLVALARKRSGADNITGILAVVLDPCAKAQLRNSVLDYARLLFDRRVPRRAD